jgi:phosphatidate cytidylyltransferase
MAAFGGLFGDKLGNVPILHFVILGILCGILSQVGDWAASAIKRYVNIKDYGRIMPGHGGVLDRVDSILFTAPLVYFYITLFIQA